jgi:hypothetical protein
MSNVRPSCMNTNSAPTHASRASKRIGSRRLFRHEWNAGYELRGPPVLRRSAHHGHSAEKEQMLFPSGRVCLFGKALRIEPSFEKRSAGKRKCRPLSSSKCRAQVLIVAHPRPEQYSSIPAEWQRKGRGGVNQGLTLPSRGCPKGCAF